LDEHQKSLEQSLKGLVSEGSHNADLAYLTSTDLKSVPYFVGQTLIAVKAPSKSQLLVPDQETQDEANERYTMYLQSQSGPIEAMLLCDEDDGSREDGAAGPAETLVSPMSPMGDDMQSAMLLQHLRSSPGKPLMARVNTKRLRTDQRGNFVRLSPPPLDSDYVYNLEENEGIADLYPIDDFQAPAIVAVGGGAAAAAALIAA
jgi:hypothetical protein